MIKVEALSPGTESGCPKKADLAQHSGAIASS
jgi:hypothetical protein